MQRAKLWFILAIAFVAICITPAARATTYQLTIDNCSGGCNPGAPGTSMGTVVTTGTGTNSLTVAVTLVSPLEFVNTGLQETIDFNLAGTPVISLTSTSNSNFSLTSTTAGSLHFDGFGDFQYAMQLNTAQGAGGAQPSPETFVIHCSTVCTETGNAGGFFFGVDVYNPVRGTTGPIGTGAPIPEASSIAFFGTGLLIAGWVLRRKLVMMW